MRVSVNETWRDHTIYGIKRFLRLVSQVFSYLDDLTLMDRNIAIINHPVFRVHGNYGAIFNQ